MAPGKYIIPVLNDDNLVKVYRNIGNFPVRTSVIKKLSGNLSVKDLAIKFVLDGEERYTMQEGNHTLKSGHYILANKFSGCHVDINRKESSKGICIDIHYDYVEQILSSLYAPNELEVSPNIKDYYFTPQLFEHGRMVSPGMRQLLHTAWNMCQKQQEVAWLNDFIKDITCQTVLDQDTLYKEYNRLHVMKPVTRKELFRRLQESLSFIQDNLMQPLNVLDIAHAVNLSEFRYYHVFKQVFGTSPHKYMQAQRLHKGIALKRRYNCSWSEIAEMVGFPDLQSFSKAFKKQFGVSPSESGR